MNDITHLARSAVVLPQGAGRLYAMGRISALFKADGDETLNQYSISEWWLEANTQGPGAHAHPEDDVFYVVEGTMSFFIKNEWIDAPCGTFILVPAGTPHNFENHTDRRAGVLNISVPGDFEKHMPGIEQWYAENPAGDAVKS